MASDVRNHPLYKYEGSVPGIRITLSNKKFKEEFAELANDNSWKTEIDGQTYVLRTQAAGYVIQTASDHVQGRISGCLIPASFKLDKVRSDDTPQTREAVSRVFKTIQMGNQLMKR